MSHQLCLDTPTSKNVNLFGYPVYTGTMRDDNWCLTAPGILMPEFLKMGSLTGIKMNNIGISEEFKHNYSDYHGMQQALGAWATKNAQKAYDVIDEDSVLIGLSGDHTGSLVTLPAAAKWSSERGASLGKLVIDQHWDYWKLFERNKFLPLPSQGGGFNPHSQVSAFNCGYGPKCLTEPLGAGSTMKPSNTLLVGPYSGENAEIEWARKDKLETVSRYDLDLHGLRLAADKIINLRKRVDYLMISVDVDALHDSWAPGSPMRSPLGLSRREVSTLLRLAGAPGEGLAPLLVLEFAEYSEHHDVEGKTVKALSSLAAETLGTSYGHYEEEMGESLRRRVTNPELFG